MVTPLCTGYYQVSSAATGVQNKGVDGRYLRWLNSWVRTYSSIIQCHQPRRARQRCLSLFKKEKKKRNEIWSSFWKRSSAAFEQKSHPLYRPVSYNHNGVYFLPTVLFWRGSSRILPGFATAIASRGWSGGMVWWGGGGGGGPSAVETGRDSELPAWLRGVTCGNKCLVNVHTTHNDWLIWVHSSGQAGMCEYHLGCAEVTVHLTWYLTHLDHLILVFYTTD